MARAANMELDALTPVSASEPLSLRFWRRYGRKAHEVLNHIANDATEAEHILKDAEYTRAELRVTAEREMVVDLHDFLRRRSKVEQVVRRADIVNDEGLLEVAQLFFGDKAALMVEAYRKDE